MCGISGIIGEPAASLHLYEAMNLLQHRGQDAAGIATSDSRHYYARRGRGLVRDVFSESRLSKLKGDMGLAHVRYPTAGSASHPGLIQPFYVNSPFGILLVHNGNLTNSRTLQDNLVDIDHRHLNTDSDSEVLLNVFAHELQIRAGHPLKPEAVFAAVRKVHENCRGAYAVIAMLIGQGLVAFRDPYGIRPLIFGSRPSVSGRMRDYMFASESIVLQSLGFKIEANLAPGETIFIDSKQTLHQQPYEGASLRPCIFEYVYLARPDSVIDGVSVYDSRKKQGEFLAEQIKRRGLHKEIDIVVPVPDTGRIAAQSIAESLDVPLSEGLMKNRYIGRTFIMRGQNQRRTNVRRKLNTIDSEFKGRKVLLVDDSIVRGTTSRQIIEMARSAGAAKVYFASAAPPLKYPNIYGIDMPISAELVAAQHADISETCAAIGADELIYQNYEDLARSVSELSDGRLKEFEDSVFSGNYLTERNNQQHLGSYLKDLADERQ